MPLRTLYCCSLQRRQFWVWGGGAPKASASWFWAAAWPWLDSWLVVGAALVECAFLVMLVDWVICFCCVSTFQLVLHQAWLCGWTEVVQAVVQVLGKALFWVLCELTIYCCMWLEYIRLTGCSATVCDCVHACGFVCSFSC